MFSYIVPNVTLSLHMVGTVYQVGWERSCGCNGQKPPTFVKLVAHCDNHVLAWYRWKKEQKWDHLRRLQELQRQDDIDAVTFRKTTQEKERAVVAARWTEQKQDHLRRLRELQRQDDIDTAAFRKATQEKEWVAIITQQIERKCQMTRVRNSQTTHLLSPVNAFYKRWSAYTCPPPS